MNLADSPFYTSGTFWAGAGTIMGVLGTIAIVWVTVRVASPKRRLYYSMPTVTSMLNKRPDLSHELKVIYGERQLNFPHVVNIELVSRGRFDIPREAFDDGEPIRLGTGAPVTECLKVTTLPTGRTVPPYKIDGSDLLVGPCLIGKRQTTVFSLLVDGPSPQLSLGSQSLVDVDIRPKDAGFKSAAPRRSVILVSITALLLIGEILYTSNVKPTPITSVIAFLFVIAGLTCAALSVFSVRRIP